MVNAPTSIHELSLERLRSAARAVGAEERLRLVVLFGSAARADAPRVEDLDLAVLPADSIDVGRVAERFIETLGIREIDLTDLRRADPLLSRLVARDGIPLHEDPAGQFARFVSLAVRRYDDTHKFREAERRKIIEFIARNEPAQ